VASVRELHKKDALSRRSAEEQGVGGIKNRYSLKIDHLFFGTL
jgi:hypothetical protein